VNVEPEPLGEQLLRDEHAVAGDDDDARLAREGREAIRLLDGDFQAHSRLLGRRRSLPSPTPLRLVRTREQELDLVTSRGQAFENRGPEGRGRGDRNPHRTQIGPRTGCGRS
jgi:hypothetical protein